MLVGIARHTVSTPALSHAFASCFDGRLSTELREAGIPVHRLPAVRLSRPWEILRARAALRHLLADTRPSVVITHSAWTRLAFGRSLVAQGAPTVAWIHGAASPVSRMDRWGQRPHPDLVLLNSRHTGDLTRELFPGAPREVLHCPVPAPPPIPPGTRDSLRRSLGAPPARTVILVAARMEPWKGHDLLFDGLSRIPGDSDWVCWIAGGPQTTEQERHRDHLVRRAQSSGLAGRFAFLGERKDVPHLMTAADLYCQPNLGPEPFGIVLVEALYAGLPVVTTALGGALEIVDDSCGRLVPPGDATALAQTLAALVEDPDLRARLGAGGPARAVDLCDPAGRIGQLHDFLSNLPAGE